MPAAVVVTIAVDDVTDSLRWPIAEWCERPFRRFQLAATARSETSDQAKSTAIALIHVTNRDRLGFSHGLGPAKASFVSTGHGLSDLTVDICGFIGRPSEQKEIGWAMEQLDAEVVETVAGVARLLRRAAELAWAQADAIGPRSSHQLLALGIDSAADEALGLLPRRARLDGPTPVGDNPAELLASAEQLMRRICVLGAPSRLLGLRALVEQLVWEANTSAGI